MPQSICIEEWVKRITNSPCCQPVVPPQMSRPECRSGSIRPEKKHEMLRQKLDDWTEEYRKCHPDDVPPPMIPVLAEGQQSGVHLIMWWPCMSAEDVELCYRPENLIALSDAYAKLSQISHRADALREKIETVLRANRVLLTEMEEVLAGQHAKDHNWVRKVQTLQQRLNGYKATLVKMLACYEQWRRIASNPAIPPSPATTQHTALSCPPSPDTDSLVAASSTASSSQLAAQAQASHPPRPTPTGGMYVSPIPSFPPPLHTHAVPGSKDEAARKRQKEAGNTSPVWGSVNPFSSNPFAMLDAAPPAWASRAMQEDADQQDPDEDEDLQEIRRRIREYERECDEEAAEAAPEWVASYVALDQISDNYPPFMIFLREYAGKDADDKAKCMGFLHEQGNKLIKEKSYLLPIFEGFDWDNDESQFLETLSTDQAFQLYHNIGKKVEKVMLGEVSDEASSDAEGDGGVLTGGAAPAAAAAVGGDAAESQQMEGASILRPQNAEQFAERRRNRGRNDKKRRSESPPVPATRRQKFDADIFNGLMNSQQMMLHMLAEEGENNAVGSGAVPRITIELFSKMWCPALCAYAPGSAARRGISKKRLERINKYFNEHARTLDWSIFTDREDPMDVVVGLGGTQPDQRCVRDNFCNASAWQTRGTHQFIEMHSGILTKLKRILDSIIEKLPPYNRITFVGHSQGGMLAIGLTALYYTGLRNMYNGITARAFPSSQNPSICNPASCVAFSPGATIDRRTANFLRGLKVEIWCVGIDNDPIFGLKLARIAPDLVLPGNVVKFYSPKNEGQRFPLHVSTEEWQESAEKWGRRTVRTVGRGIAHIRDRLPVSDGQMGIIARIDNVVSSAVDGLACIAPLIRWQYPTVRDHCPMFPQPSLVPPDSILPSRLTNKQYARFWTLFGPHIIAHHLPVHLDDQLAFEAPPPCL